MALVLKKRISAGLVIRATSLELLVMEKARVVAKLRVPVDGPEPERFSGALKQLIAASDAPLNTIAAAMPTHETLVRFFTIPVVPKSEWDTAVQFEARKYIPFKIDTLIWDYRVMASATSKTRLDVVFAAALREPFLRAQEMISDAGVQPVVIEPRSVSLARLTGGLLNEKSARANAFICVVDVGDEGAHLVIIKNRLPYLTRDISFAATAIPPRNPPATAATPSTPIEGSPAAGGSAEPVASAASPEELASVPEKGIDRRAQRLLTELSVSIDFFTRENPSTTIREILLVGDERVIAPWQDAFAEPLRCPVTLGYRLIEPYAPNGLPLAFASAMGVLQGGRESSRLAIDFLKRSMVKPAGAPKGVASTFGLTQLLTFSLVQTILFVVLAVAALAGSWVAGAMKVAEQQGALDEAIRARPDVGWGLPMMKPSDVETIRGKTSAQLMFLGALMDRPGGVTGFFDALARSLPDGVWLTDLAFEQTAEPNGKGQLRLTINGACYLAESGRELAAIQSLEQALKARLQPWNLTPQLDRVTANPLPVQASTPASPSTYRTFQLRCGMGPSLS